MKYILSMALAFLIYTSMGFAHSNYGKKLEIAVDPSSGKPKSVAMIYSYDFSMGWYLSVTTALSAGDISALPDILNIKFLNLSTGKVYYSQDGVSKKQLLNSNVILRDDAILRDFLPTQKNLALTFSIPGGDYVYYLPLNDICSNFPTYVNDLTKPANQACVVDPNDFQNKRVDCAAENARLVDLVKQGLSSCAAAKSTYASLGCGTFKCP